MGEEEEDSEDEMDEDEDLEEEEEKEDENMEVDEPKVKSNKSPAKPVQLKTKPASAGPFSNKVSVAVNPPNSLILTTPKATITSKMIGLSSTAKTPLKLVTSTTKVAAAAVLKSNSSEQNIEVPATASTTTRG